MIFFPYYGATCLKSLDFQSSNFIPGFHKKIKPLLFRVKDSSIQLHRCHERQRYFDLNYEYPHHFPYPSKIGFDGGEERSSKDLEVFFLRNLNQILIIMSLAWTMQWTIIQKWLIRVSEWSIHCLISANKLQRTHARMKFVLSYFRL